MDATSDESGSGVQQPIILTHPVSFHLMVKLMVGSMVAMVVMVAMLFMAAWFGAGIYIQKTLEMKENIQRIEKAQEAARLRSERLLRGQLKLIERLKRYVPEEGESDDD